MSAPALNCTALGKTYATAAGLVTALRDVDLIVEPREDVPLGAEGLARAAAPDGAQLVGHDRFGTVRIESAGGALDVATVRRESYARPGALPSVEAGTLDDDLRRRDFTVNALAVPITTAARRGRPALIDPGSGRDDVSRGILRVFHAEASSTTRRARAAARSPGGQVPLSRGSRTALRDAIGAGASAVPGIAGGANELFDDARRGLDPAAVAAARGGMSSGRRTPPGAEARGPGVATTQAHPRYRRCRPRDCDPGPWASRCGSQIWMRSRRRMLRRRRAGELAQRLTVSAPAQPLSATLATARGRGAGRVAGDIDEERLLALFAYAPPASRRRLLRWALEDRTRRPPVTGADLVAAGLAGPVVGAALARIRLAWLDGAVHTRDEAIALAREVAARLGRRSAARPHKPAKRAAARPAAAKSTKASLPAPEPSSILPPASPPTRALHPERQ
jgi:hypothetical protein